MSWEGFVGPLLLGAGPLAVAFLAALAGKSFLVLLFLGSAFYWLCTLFVVSAVFIGFEPLPGTLGATAALLLVGVGAQEAARYGLWRFHALSLRVLSHLARPGGPYSGHALTAGDRLGLALAHGLAWGAVQSTFLWLAWLPNALGDGTYYAAACPQLSVYLVGALSTLAIAGVLGGGTVVYLDALERRTPGWRRRAALAGPAAHAAAAFATLGNLAQDGCVATLPLLLAGGAAVTAWATRVWWERTAPARPPPEAAAEGDERAALQEGS